MREIFEKRALRNRHQAGDKTTPIVVLSPPLRTTLGLGVALAAVGVLWAFLAKIPIEVKGTGVLLPVGEINRVRSQVGGIARWMFAEKQNNWVADVQQFQRQPDQLSDAAVLDLSRRILLTYSTSEFSAPSQANGVLSSDRIYPKGTLLIWLQSLQEQESLQAQVDTLVSVGRLNRIQQKTLIQKQSILEQELKSRQSFLNSMLDLTKKGFVSRPTILQNQAEVDNLKSKVFSNRDSLVHLQTELQQSFIKLRKSLAQMISNGFVFADYDLYIRQVIPNNGEGVSQGDPLLLLSRHSLSNPVQVPVFLSERESAQVTVGMSVLVTPVGMRRSEVGGILGRVVQMSELPSGDKDLEARIGSSSLAKVIQQREPSPTLAIVELQRSDQDRGGNRGGYVWNSKSDLPFSPKTADQLNVSITTRRVAPISLVIPRLRLLLGLAPPEPRLKQDRQSDQSSSLLDASPEVSG
ncbi:putative conserved membrane protein [Synechococcus sp. BIOS-U3-1]|uniref:hypothetical protein n=1 Tax=Synechococcus sp. BIOS-U3-1 TaxID=1400865 RepID=UPI0016476FC2|nr:hypothetical protein [Synechococcus sp. BIOS-U3-1]QNI57894.1 putative conserved membrane protein [Synechococcus sp. BIOS-U3-1]